MRFIPEQIAARIPRGRGPAVAAVAAATAVAATGLATAAALARRAVIPARRLEEPAEVVGLERAGDRLIARLRGLDTSLPGVYSFVFDGGRGHARLGDALQRRRGETAREVVRIDRGNLREGAKGRISGWWYAAPEELGLEVERIEIETELGPADAWLFRPPRSRNPLRRSRGRWAVHVHGRGALPQETLRGVVPLAELGITNLVISYRNDPGAPPGGGRYGFGLSEARDVDAAVGEAVRRGATRVTLVGWSMGGTASVVAARTGANRDFVDGVILDSPALDWPALLHHHGAVMRMPAAVTGMGIRMLARGSVRGGEAGGIDFTRLTPAGLAEDLQVPVLIHASRADTFVPPSGAERFAELRPGFVQLRLNDAGEHTKLWNVDPDGWERATSRFAAALPRPPWRGGH